MFGFGIWLLMAAIFLVPGWLLASFRRKVLVDRTQRDHDRARAVGRDVATFTGLRFRDDVERGVDEDADASAS